MKNSATTANNIFTTLFFLVRTLAVMERRMESWGSDQWQLDEKELGPETVEDIDDLSFRLGMGRNTSAAANRVVKHQVNMLSYIVLVKPTGRSVGSKECANYFPPNTFPALPNAGGTVDRSCFGMICRTLQNLQTNLYTEVQ